MTRVKGAGRLAAGALALVLATALAACTRSGDPVPTPGTGPATPPPTFSGVRHPLPTGSALANDPELYGRAELTGCAAVSGGWKASGTLKNPGAAEVAAVIVVLFTDAQARAVDSATAEVRVSAGRTGTWSATRAFRAPEGTRCVLRAVRPAPAD